MPDDVWGPEDQPQQSQDAKDVWNTTWVWKEVAREAGQAAVDDGFTLPALSEFQTMDYGTAKNLITTARQHKRRAKMIGTVAKELEAGNQAELDIRKSWHGLARHALKMVFGGRKEDAQTSKEYAKVLADTKVLGHKTTNDIAYIAHNAGNSMALSDNGLTLRREQSDHRLESLASLQQHRLQQAKLQIDNQLAASKKEAEKPEWLP